MDGLQEPVGLARGDPGEDAVEMSADHCGDFFHRLALPAQHVTAPALEQEACNVWLLAREDLAQVLTVLPGACGARGGHLGEQPIELRALCGGERGTILQQHPALAPEARVEILLDAAHLVDGLRSMGDDVEFVEGDLSTGQMLADSAGERRRPVDTDRLDLGRLAVMGTQIRLDGGGILALGDEDYSPPCRIRVRIGEERHGLVPEDVQMPVDLGDRAVHRMYTFLPRHGKAAADLKVNTDIESSLARIGMHPGDEPGTTDAEGRLDDLLCHHRDRSICWEHKSYPSAGSTDFPFGSAGAYCDRPARQQNAPGPPADYGDADPRETRAVLSRITHTNSNRAQVNF